MIYVELLAVVVFHNAFDISKSIEDLFNMGDYCGVDGALMSDALLGHIDLCSGKLSKRAEYGGTHGIINKDGSVCSEPQQNKDIPEAQTVGIVRIEDYLHSYELCCELCTKNPFCKAFVFTIAGMCYMKTAAKPIVDSGTSDRSVSIMRPNSQNPNPKGTYEFRSFPWTAAIIWPELTPGAGTKVMCSAVLVTENIVLTAASCFKKQMKDNTADEDELLGVELMDEDEYKQFRVLLGYTAFDLTKDKEMYTVDSLHPKSLSGYQQILSIKKVIYHPDADFIFDTKEDTKHPLVDLAAIKLDGDVSMTDWVKPACLNGDMIHTTTLSATDGCKGYIIAGFGPSTDTTKEHIFDNLANTQKHINKNVKYRAVNEYLTRVTSLEACRSYVKNTFQDNMLCVTGIDEKPFWTYKNSIWDGVADIKSFTGLAQLAYDKAKAYTYKFVSPFENKAWNGAPMMAIVQGRWYVAGIYHVHRLDKDDPGHIPLIGTHIASKYVMNWLLDVYRWCSNSETCEDPNANFKASHNRKKRAAKYILEHK